LNVLGNIFFNIRPLKGQKANYMVVYSIKDMENLSGIKAHTLRMWEKRYNIISPKRTPTNIRYYTDEDLRHLLNVSYLNKKGIKISKIAKMDSDEIKETVSMQTELSLSADDQIETLLLFIYELDSFNVNKILNSYIKQIGLEETMNELIYPLLEKLSLAWLAGSFKGAHETFTTQIIKSKILHSTELLESKSTSGPCYLIYLAEGETQELSMLYLHFLLRKNECRVINLGTNVSLEDVLEACQITKPEFVFTILNNEMSNKIFQTYVDEVVKAIPDGTFLTTGYLPVTQKISWPDKAVVLKTLSDTIDFITSQKN